MTDSRKINRLLNNDKKDLENQFELITTAFHEAGHVISSLLNFMMISTVAVETHKKPKKSDTHYNLGYTDYVVIVDYEKIKDQKLAHDLAMHIAAARPETPDDLMAQPFIKDQAITVKDLIDQYIAKLGENIQVGRFEIFEI